MLLENRLVAHECCSQSKGKKTHQKKNKPIKKNQHNQENPE